MIAIYVCGSNKNGQLALDSAIEYACTLTPLVVSNRDKNFCPTRSESCGSPILSPTSPKSLVFGNYILPSKFLQSSIVRVACGKNHSIFLTSMIN
jgi:alpha-tubulin suppressor-like RCC1 family protein